MQKNGYKENLYVFLKGKTTAKVSCGFPHNSKKFSVRRKKVYRKSIPAVAERAFFRLEWFGK